MKLKSIFLSVVTLLAVLFLGACSQSSNGDVNKDQWTTYESNKKITIGFDNTFVPMGFEDKSGKNVGFDIDLATAVFKKYGIEVNWQPINWDLKETELKNGTIDLIWNGYSKTKEREEKVLFTNPYMENEQVLVTKKSSKISEVADMKDKILGAQAGSSGYQVFEEKPDVLKNLVKDQAATQYESFNEALIDLQNSRIDGLLIDRVYANYYLKEQGILADYTIIPVAYDGENFAVGARQSDKTLVENINKAFKDLYKEGTFQEISKKWFGDDVATADVKK
ncbi:amino acid ABC transporter substrate-binding protein [Streptococcus himalayensis]|uniref:Glutamine ABC transporter substrate-binding protein n=1 Tax=Streptococcus himalayensis TaxID=1888195 RepID=A0A917A7K5_9STRE|nr:amino acid ABC transporter substrate-binding protein [Streptococcus himalayensis]GGE32969.1 glutamine ABC transporter substrate-binding protein [Streptococcus himalayensis]